MKLATSAGWETSCASGVDGELGGGSGGGGDGGLGGGGGGGFGGGGGYGGYDDHSRPCVVTGIDALGTSPQPKRERLGMKLSDIHEGWQGLHRPDPVEPAANAYRRSASDITLQASRSTRLAAAAAARAAAREGAADGAADDSGVRSGASKSGYGRRRTEITRHEEPVVQMGATSPGSPQGIGLGKQVSDIHLGAGDRCYRLHESASQKQLDAQRAEANDGRPKYGRRRYPLTLYASDYDLLQV